MKINLSGHHIDITDSLRSYVEDKMSKLDRHFDNITSGQVTLTVIKERMTAEAIINLSGAELHASQDGDDMYACIDQMVDKMVRQVQKHKEKLVARRQGQG